MKQTTWMKCSSESELLVELLISALKKLFLFCLFLHLLFSLPRCCDFFPSSGEERSVLAFLFSFFEAVELGAIFSWFLTPTKVEFRGGS